MQKELNYLEKNLRKNNKNVKKWKIYMNFTWYKIIKI